LPVSKKLPRKIHPTETFLSLRVPARLFQKLLEIQLQDLANLLRELVRENRAGRQGAGSTECDLISSRTDHTVKHGFARHVEPIHTNL